MGRHKPTAGVRIGKSGPAEDSRHQTKSCPPLLSPPQTKRKVDFDVRDLEWRFGGRVGSSSAATDRAQAKRRRSVGVSGVTRFLACFCQGELSQKEEERGACKSLSQTYVGHHLLVAGRSSIGAVRWQQAEGATSSER